MKREGVLALALVLTSVQGVPAEVRVSPESVRIESRGQSLSDVLNQLSRSAAFEVKYQGPAPSNRVFALIESHSVTEAVGRLLDGAGVTWAARFDPTGTKIELLVIGGPIQAAPAGAAASTRNNRVDTPPEPVEEQVYEPPPAMEVMPEPEPPPPPPTPQASTSTPSSSFGSSFGNSFGSGSSWSGPMNSGGSQFTPPTNSGIGWSQPGAPSTPQPPVTPGGASLP